MKHKDEDGEGGTLLTVLKDETNSSPEDEVSAVLNREAIARVLETLPPMSRQVLVLRFGLEGEQVHTLEATGQRLKITRDRVQHIEQHALDLLRAPRITSQFNRPD